MIRVGVIDIGPSSIRLLLTEVSENGYFKIIDELKTSIRLCHDLVNTCSLCNDKINSIVSTLNSFKSLCRVSGASDIFAVATESFRTAENKDLIISSIKEQLNIDVKVLSCEEEIYYNFLGLKRSINIKNSLMVEVAGTDTHIAWVNNNEIIKSITIPFGSVNLSYDCKLTDRILKDNLDLATEKINSYLNNIEWITENTFDSIIGVAATIRNIGKIDRLRKRYPFDIPNNYELSDIDIHDIFNISKSKDAKQRQKLEGIDPELSDIIVGGILLFDRIVKVSKTNKIIVSSRGLREGIMYEYLENNFDITSNILDYSIDGILDNLNINKEHASHVYNITSKLFNSLKPLHHLGDEFSNIIKTATMLHDCGISVDYYNHHKHSFYIILNSHIDGLSHKEILLSAAIAASHRFNNYELPLPPFSSIVNQLDLKSIRSIGVLVKIAEGLDRSLVGAIKDIDVQFDDTTITITVYSDINVDFEIRQALRASNKVMDIYKRKLIILEGSNLSNI